MHATRYDILRNHLRNFGVHVARTLRLHSISPGAKSSLAGGAVLGGIVGTVVGSEPKSWWTRLLQGAATGAAVGFGLYFLNRFLNSPP